MGLTDGELAGVIIGGIVGGVLLIILLLWLFRRWMQGPKITSTARLEGKVVVITGANTGLGKETALEMSKRGGKVVILCRNTDKGEDVAKFIEKETGGDVIVHKLDLSSLASVRGCVAQLNNSLEKIDILINNAGIMMCPEMRTTEGFEMQLGTNHLGHFLLTNLLLPLIKRAAPGARIVTVSSLAAMRGGMQWEDLNWERKTYDSTKAYQQSKLANILFTKELARQLEGSGVTTYCLHPGVVNTELGRHLSDTYGSCVGCIASMVAPLMKTPEAGARTSIYCAIEEEIETHTGRYYSDCRETEPTNIHANNLEDAKKLWGISKQLTGLD